MGVYRDLERIFPDSSIFPAFLWEKLTGKQHKTNSGLPVIQANFELFTTSCEQPI
jgi:hypothetical protein